MISISTYAQNVKEEISRIPSDAREKMAILDAFLRLNASFGRANNESFIEFETSQNFISRKFLSLIKEFYDCRTSIFVKEYKKLNQKHHYIVRIETMVDAILEEYKFYDDNIQNKELYLEQEDLSKAYLRGAFLVKGTVNNPKTSKYHLEISSKSSKDTVFIQTLMNNFYLDAKVTKRRNDYVAYIKSSQKIKDFLRIIGCSKQVFVFEEEVLNRNFAQDVARVMNCDIANEVKVHKAANSQLKDIQYLEFNYPLESLDSKILLIMKLRKKYPEASLIELVDRMKADYDIIITKSGLNHRFRKLHEIAEDYKSKREN